MCERVIQSKSMNEVGARPMDQVSSRCKRGARASALSDINLREVVGRCGGGDMFLKETRQGGRE